MTPRLHVHVEVLRDMLRLPPGRDEVGGWLLGYWTADESALVVTHATPALSTGTPSGVTVSGEGHRPFFEAAWGESGGRITFLGDWHTHPGSSPLPSSQDRAAMKQLAHDEDFGTPQPLVAITSVPRWRGQRRPRDIAFYLRTAEGNVVVMEAAVFSEMVPAGRDVRSSWSVHASA